MNRPEDAAIENPADCQEVISDLDLMHQSTVDPGEDISQKWSTGGRRSSVHQTCALVTATTSEAETYVVLIRS